MAGECGLEPNSVSLDGHDTGRNWVMVIAGNDIAKVRRCKIFFENLKKSVKQLAAAQITK